jgi:ribonuclease HII
MLDDTIEMVSLPNLLFEIQSGGIVAGVDEAGRGSWAGSVVAGAVILNQKYIPEGINDSKKLSAAKRELLYEEILQNARTGIGISTVEEIDEVNILEATKLAMQRAVAMLGNDISLVLVDGNKAPALPFPTQTIIGGDAKSLSIAAASIIAKVTRDKIMQELGGINPEYGWKNNSGYGTKHHIEALAKYGITKHHRKSYKPIRELMENL